MNNSTLWMIVSPASIGQLPEVREEQASTPGQPPKQKHDENKIPQKYLFCH
jgi:hypothetical protein